MNKLTAAFSFVWHFIRARKTRVLAQQTSESQQKAFRQWQQTTLQKHLDWVCEHSPYYAQYKGKPLSDFPLMDKQCMMDNLDTINSAGLETPHLMPLALNAEHSRQFNDSTYQDVTVGLSSGTSGRRGLFLANKAERLLWAATITGKMLPSIWKKQRIALLLRADSPLYHSVKRHRVQFHYCDLTQPLETWLADLERFAPTLMVGSAQALMLAAKHQTTLSPERVISGAEVLLPEDKEWLEKQLDTDVHEIYQCTEGFLACSYASGILRWNEDLVHIEREWLNDKKTHYVPIITDFRRTTQPIIRYRLDDVIEHKDDSGTFSAIGAIIGRCGDRFFIPSVDTQLYPPLHAITLLPDLIARAVMLAAEKHCNYRITQIGHRDIRIEAPYEYQQSISVGLAKLFAKQGAISVNFHYADAPTWQPSIKQRRVVNAMAVEKLRTVSEAKTSMPTETVKSNDTERFDIDVDLDADIDADINTTVEEAQALEESHR